MPRKLQLSPHLRSLRQQAGAPRWEPLEPRVLLAAVTEQIIVDQFGWRADSDRKVAILADPVTGQNSAISYTPGATFQVRRTSDGVAVLTSNTTAWHAGATQPQSGDRVWYADFSSLNTPGTYYLYDPANDLKSFDFQISDDVYSQVLTASMRTFYYQRCGTEIDAAHGGNWVHDDCHVGPNQDLAAVGWLNGAATGPGTRCPRRLARCRRHEQVCPVHHRRPVGPHAGL